MGVQSHTACCSAQHWKIVQWQDCWHTSMATCSLPGAARHPQPCHAQLPSLPGSLAVWFGDVWTAVTQQPAPPLHADLLLADDRRGPWQPAAGLDSLWQRLRLMVITQLRDAYCRARSRSEQPMQAAHIAAKVISAARSQRLAACRLRHSAPSWGAQPLALPRRQPCLLPRR